MIFRYLDRVCRNRDRGVNPKLHDIPRLKKSIRRFGFVAPVVIDTLNRQLVAGHGRTAALAELRADGCRPPRHVTVKAGEWMVPAITGAFFGSKEDAEAYGVADNRLVELGGWSNADLLVALRELKSEGGEELLDAIGWPKETREMVEALVEGGREFAVDALPAVEGAEDTRPGRIILLYEDKRQKRAWIRQLGLRADFDNVIVMPEDAV